MNTTEKNVPLPCNRQVRPAPASPAVATEQEFLDRELQATAGRMRSEVRHIKASIPQALDLRLWTKRYPWTSVGLAAGAGFLTARLVGSRSNRQPRPETEATPEKQQRVVAEAECSLFGGLLDGVLSTLRVLIADCLRTVCVSLLGRSVYPDPDYTNFESRLATATPPESDATSDASPPLQAVRASRVDLGHETK